VQRLSGIGVSGGAGAGRAVVLIQRAQVLRFSIAASQIGAEIARLEQARQRSAAQLDRIQLRLPGHDLRTLFEAQRADGRRPDAPASGGIDVGEQRINAEWALQQVFDHLGSVFDGVEDPYLRSERATSRTSSAGFA
jgi:phosphotransferase system enzyme I (PtsI)